jgi:hypothetical protein
MGRGCLPTSEDPLSASLHGPLETYEKMTELQDIYQKKYLNKLRQITKIV